MSQKDLKNLNTQDQGHGKCTVHNGFRSVYFKAEHFWNPCMYFTWHTFPRNCSYTSRGWAYNTAFLSLLSKGLSRQLLVAATGEGEMLNPCWHSPQKMEWTPNRSGVLMSPAKATTAWAFKLVKKKKFLSGPSFLLPPPSTTVSPWNHQGSKSRPLWPGSHDYWRWGSVAIFPFTSNTLTYVL